jgi:hypothetical protein
VQVAVVSNNGTASDIPESRSSEDTDGDYVFVTRKKGHDVGKATLPVNPKHDENRGL